MTASGSFCAFGWIALDVGEHCDWAEIEALMLESYRHFALKRMLLQLPI
jgi:hypothetical protein